MDPILHKLFMAGAKRKEPVFVAVGAGGLVATSPDGLVWTTRTAAAVRDWTSVCFGDGKFVAVAGGGGSGSRVMTSPDGITWTAYALTNNVWNKVAWGVNSFGTRRFVAVGDNVMRYSADGATWSAGSGFSNSVWQSVALGDTGIAVAVASAGTERIHTSSDGNSWADRTEPSVSEWRNVCFHGPAGRFIAVAAADAQRIALSTSSSGASWTNPTTPQANQWFDVCSGPALAVAVALDGTNRVMTSPDGSSWTLRSASSARLWNAVIYGRDRYIAISADGYSMYSMDGINWSNGGNLPAAGFAAIAYGAI